MPKLSERGVIHLLLPLILLLGIAGGVFLVTRGEPLKLLPKATVSGPPSPQTSFTLLPDKSIYSKDSEIIVKVLVRSDTDPANLFVAKIMYDQEVLKLNKIDTASSFVKNWVEQSQDIPGEISLVGGVSSPGIQTKTGEDAVVMAELHFTVLKTGNTAISLKKDSAIYSNSDNINILSEKSRAIVISVEEPGASDEGAPEKVLYVDDDAGIGGDGSSGKPFKTIKEALAQTQEHTKIMINPGVYNEAVQITRNFIILEGMSSVNSVVKGSPPSSAVIQINSLDGNKTIEGVQIRKLKIEANGNQGIFVIGYAKNIKIEQNNIVQLCGTCKNTSMGGVHMQVASDSNIAGNYIQGFGSNIFLSAFSNMNNKIEFNYLTKASYAGVQFHTIQSDSNNQVLENLFINNKFGLVNWYDQNDKYYYNFFIRNSENGLADLTLAGGNRIYNNSFIDNKVQIYIYPGVVDILQYDFDKSGNYFNNFDEEKEGAFDNNNDGVVDAPFIVNDKNKDERPFVYTLGRYFPKPSVLVNPVILHAGDQFSLIQNDSDKFPPADSGNKVILNFMRPREAEAEIISWSETEIIAKLKTDTKPGIYHVWIKTTKDQLPVWIGVAIAVVSVDDMATLPTTVLPKSGPSPSPTPAPDSCAGIGDVNLDGKIDSTDSLVVLRINAGYIKPTDEQKRRGDVNGDGKVNSTDSLLILRYDAGFIKTFPVCQK